MLQVRIHGPNDVRLDEVPTPEAGPKDVILRVAACGICGSDLGYIQMGGLMGPTDQPMPLGHELAGVIENVGSEVQGFAVGDRVALDPRNAESGPIIGNGGPEGGFAPLLRVRNAADRKMLHRLPTDMPFEIAALAEPLGVGMNAVDKAFVSPGEQAVVFGAGPIGLSAVASLRDAGAEKIVSVDFSEHRLGLARTLGASETIQPAREDVFGRLRAIHGEVDFMGAPAPATDAYIEASGAGSVLLDVIGGARRGARLSVVALHRKPVEVNFLLVLMRELQITGAMEYPEDFGRGIDVLKKNDLSALITHRFPLERFEEALAVARDPEVAGKVMIEVD